MTEQADKVMFKRIVVKLGTSTLTGGTQFLSPPRILDIVRQIAAVQRNGQEILLVSSGAMAAGKEALNFPQLPKQIPAKQMLAAVGQPRLMNLYTQLFGIFSLPIAQVLLTRGDMENRRSYLNARNSLQALLAQGVIPIINENDTVATEEIRVGDNDNLSAQVAILIEADLLLMLTDQPGLFTADPRTTPDASRIKRIDSSEIPEEIWKAAGGSRSDLGTGGMLTKLQAADLARRSGTTVVVARGSDPEILPRILTGEDAGTWFLPSENILESRKRYILMTGRYQSGSVVIDRGAEQALSDGGSLLPVGITNIEGVFERGDAIRVMNETGKEIARGLTNYSRVQLIQIAGQRSQAIESVLGFTYGDEVIHRNDLVLLAT
jgi:glutamate 5-kinase